MTDSDSTARFLDAVRGGDMENARRLLAADPAMADRDIAVAAIVGDAEGVARLLAEDPARSVATGGPRQWAPILYLAHSRFHLDGPERAAGIASAARLLIDAGADPNTGYFEADFPDSPLSALYVATGVTNNPELARVLLEEGANPNDGESIYHAAEENNRACLELLREHGGDISSRSERWKNTPLYFLMGHREGTPQGITSTEGMRWLLEHGADPNITSYDCRETPLHLAARTGRGPGTVAMLLDHGADVNARESSGFTAHTLAARNGNEAVATLLLERGAADETTAIDRFIAACAGADAVAAEAILAENPGMLGELQPADHAALPHAAGLNRADAVRTMLDAGFDVAARGEAGATALHHAAWWGNDGVVDLILTHNPPLEQHCSAFDATPLDWAVHGSFSSPNRGTPGHAKVVESILAAGAVPRTGLADVAAPEIAEIIRKYAGEGERS